jgi:membrane protease YdiL (CAAX protease family)
VALAVLGSLACIALFSYLPLLLPWLEEYGGALIAAGFIYIPAFVLWRRGETFASVGVDGRRPWPALATTLAAALVVFPLFAVGFFFYHYLLFGKTPCFVPERLFSWPGWSAASVPGLSGVVTFALVQLIMVALPEEIFYRGYLQSRLQSLLPGRLVILGGDVGPAVIVTSIVFAVGHLVAIPSPHRLAVFFPSLLFGWLRNRTGSVVGPILLHAAANVLQALLGTCLC